MARPRSPTTIIRGKPFEIAGIPELVKKLQGLGDAVSVGSEAYGALTKAAAYGHAEMKRYMDMRNWPHETFESTFVYGKVSPPPRAVAALYGIRKRGRSQPYAPAYVEWGKRAGKLLGESLATMFEFGTSKMSARPAVRPSITAAKPAMAQIAAEEFRAIIERCAKA